MPAYLCIEKLKVEKHPFDNFEEIIQLFQTLPGLNTAWNIWIEDARIADFLSINEIKLPAKLPNHWLEAQFDFENLKIITNLNIFAFFQNKARTRLYPKCVWNKSQLDFAKMLEKAGVFDLAKLYLERKKFPKKLKIAGKFRWNDCQLPLQPRLKSEFYLWAESIGYKNGATWAIEDPMQLLMFKFDEYISYIDMTEALEYVLKNDCAIGTLLASQF